MAVWSKIWPFSRKAMGNETLALLRDVYGTRETKSGSSVTTSTALEVTAVLRCASIIADGISTVPLRLFRKDADTGKRLPAEDHPLYEVLSVEPNPWQDSLEFRETIAFHVALTGNAFVFVNRVNNRVAELIPIEPNRVSVKQNSDYSIVYKVTTIDGKLVDFPQNVIWHIKGPSWNSFLGMEPVRLAREAIGLGMALESSHASFHKNGLKASGVYSVDGMLPPQQMEALRKVLEAMHAGAENTGKPIIVDRSAKWFQTSMTGVDAQHLETRKFQIEEICRAFGVMPIMVGYSDKAATYASAEQMFLAHAVHTIRPWHRRFEMSIKRNLLTKAERDQGYYPKFIDTELLRGAAADRAEYYAKGINAGWLLRNEAREWEELDPVEGLSEPLTPVNMTVGNPVQQTTGAQ